MVFKYLQPSKMIMLQIIPLVYYDAQQCQFVAGYLEILSRRTVVHEWKREYSGMI